MGSPPATAAVASTTVVIVHAHPAMAVPGARRWVTSHPPVTASPAATARQRIKPLLHHDRQARPAIKPENQSSVHAPSTIRATPMRRRMRVV